MDKYLVRRASPSKNDSKAKRVKSAPEEEEGNNSPARRGASVKKKKSTKSLLEEEDDDDDAESSGVDGDIYGGLAFEDEPLAAIESLNDVIGGDGGGSSTSEKTEEQPTLYRSSIYVDAFNMALDTVLEQEAHLFTDPEKAVFAAWRLLDYEAQYLYVRLFLRKQAAWHRIQRLDYRADIGDLARAVETLQKDRACGGGGGSSGGGKGGGEDGDGEDGDWSLGPSFSFAQTLDNVEMAIDEVVGLLSLSELKAMAKQIKAVGKSKAELQAGIVRVTTKQMTLTSAGQLLRRQSSMGLELATASGSESPGQPALRRNSSTSSGREEELTANIMAITGPCIRICPAVFKLFERVHLVFYRTSEWTDKSLTTLVLAKMSKRNFPEYVVSRTANIFASRQQLLDFEAALRLQHRVDQILNNNMSSGGGEDGYQQVVDLFNSIGAHWRGLVKEELEAAAKYDDEYDEYSYLRRFKAAHVLTRVAHYAAYCMGRLHDYRSEHALLGELLGQRLLHLARRGVWYQRKALIEERYMAAAGPECGSKMSAEQQQQQQKKLWWSRALATCEAGLQDRDCHTIFHHDLQKRIVKLEKRLRIPRRLQHDFGHLRLLQPEEHVIEGIQVKRAVEGGGLFNNKKRKGSASVGERTVWIDEGENEGKDVECTVEEMCLREYRRRGWKGYHAEGGIVRTLFAYLFYDVLFMYVPNVFQTAYQACPLDLHTDAFYAARASAINRRLVEIANGEAPRIVHAVHAAQAARRTCIVGLRWEQFGLDDLVELVACFRGDALALVCKVLAQEYRQRGGGGLPDLLLWRRAPTPEVLFAEVKSANDRLSETQRMWIHVLAGAGVRVAVCHAVAKETRVR